MSCEHGDKYVEYSYSDAGEIRECLACSLDEERRLNKKLFDKLYKVAELANSLVDIILEGEESR